jgi:hypothetical protein
MSRRDFRFSARFRKSLGDFSGPIRLPRYAASWRGVMQVGLLRSHGRLLRPISACDRMKLQTIFDAARLLICCEPRWAGRDMPVGLLIVGQTNQWT